MNLFETPDDGRRSLESLRVKVAWLENQLAQQKDEDGFPSPYLEADLTKAKEALAQAEREAMK